MSINISDLLQPAIALAENAATEILKIYRSEFEFQHKSDNTP